MLRILHASDLQCGRPYLADAAEALVEFATAVRPDVIVVSGDLTQRAKQSEFRAVADLFARFPPVPLIVTPGNHDVPLWRAWERAFAPYSKWRRAFPGPLDTVSKTQGATFVALNSSAPRRALVNGRLDGVQVELARRTFSQLPPGEVRALVVHHHFVPTVGSEGGPPIPGAARRAREFEAMGVDLALGGHVHHTHVRLSTEITGGDEARGFPFIACGTTTSRRGRRPEEGRNSLNVVDVGSSEIVVRPHLRMGAAFEPIDPITFPRSGAPRTEAHA